MSTTHRGLNRLLLLILAVFMLAIGLATALAGAWPTARQYWTDSLTQSRNWLSEQLAASRIQIADWQISWIWLALVAVLILALILLLCWIGSQGGGRTGVLEREEAPEGSLTMRDDIAQSTLKEALNQDARVLSSSVSAWQIKKQAGLKISIQARKGSSPRQLADSVENLVTGLDRLLGRELPVLISINAGARSGWSHEHRVQ
ncbi:hypothetical protein [Psychromicrobium sp. YIM B11713]|uniref:hypothetical protein n=1 Tax=Psychromicrobium sp. YIM B11713 TaxID=3145233 RepID=UPI00374FC65C